MGYIPEFSVKMRKFCDNDITFPNSTSRYRFFVSNGSLAAPALVLLLDFIKYGMHLQFARNLVER